MSLFPKLAKLVLFVFALCCPCVWAEEISGKVERWVDGDTCVFVADSGEKIRVRLWLVDAPESKQPMGSTVTTFMKNHPDIGTGRRVILDKITTDRYGRTIGKLRGEGKSDCIGGLFASGYFWFYEPAAKNRRGEAAQLKRIYESAKTEKRGLFKYCSSVPPWEWRKMNKQAQNDVWKVFEAERRSTN